MQYREELVKSMRWLASQEHTLFIGQAVRYPGHAIFNTLEDAEVPMGKRYEMPVTEELQMGISIGLALQGYIPISIFPRMDFLIIAMNQLVNHLDKFEKMTHGDFCPKVIIRTMVGSRTPLDGGIQHTGDYTKGLRHLLHNINVISLERPSEIFASYRWSVTSPRSTILIEKGNLYDCRDD